MNAPVFFFTAEDPREIPKGSRDPLRFLPTWTRIARRMIPHLTTVTPSYRGFLTRLLFHGALEGLAPDIANGPRERQWDVFCKFEQLCGLVRSAETLSKPTPNFPGITGVSGRIKDSHFIVGNETPYWLMKSQKNTGYWGYYHQAGLGSGLLKLNKANPPGYVLTEPARQAFLHSPAYRVFQQYKDVFLSLCKNKTAKFEIGQFEALSKLYADKPLEHAGWGEFWFRSLLTANSDGHDAFSAEVQERFASAIQKVGEPSLSSGLLWERLVSSDDIQVREHALTVQATEAVIGLCEWVFEVCRLRHDVGESLSAAEQWAKQDDNYNVWLDRLGKLRPPPDEDLQRYRYIALQTEHSFIPLAKTLIDRHKNVMAARNGAPWVELADQGMLNVRDPANDPWPSNFNKHFEEYPSGVRWRYDYFLGSWLSIAKEIGYIAEGENG